MNADPRRLTDAARGEERRSARRRLVAASLVLGVGLGGSFDGIVLHQVLRWHHLVSGVSPIVTLQDLELNTFWDGAFQAVTWMVIAIGVLLLAGSVGARHAHAGHRTLFGGVLLGWGAFNLVEGILDHHLLQLHHVRPGPDELAYDLGFLAWGAVMAALGGWLLRRSAAIARNEPY